MNEFLINDDNILVSYNGPGGHIRVPDGVKAIGGSAFLHGDPDTIFQVVLPEGLEEIGFRAFENCENLTRIYLPSTLKTIGHNAFSRCIRLERVVLPQGLEEIGDHAFASCEKLENIILPQGLKTIGARAFGGCNSLTEVTVPDSVETLGDAAFGVCRSLKTARLPAGLKTLPTWCFNDCCDLECAELPEGLETIEGGAFAGCGRLHTVNIPQSVHTIGSRAFQNCVSLSDAMILPAGLKKLGAEAFAKCTTQSFSMGAETFAGFSCRIFPGGNAGLAVLTEKGWRFYAYAAKSNSDVLSDYVRRGQWNNYDLQLLNNGPMYKFKASAKLLGSLGRLVDPVDLTDECRELYKEFLVKNAKKLIPIAESLRCSAIVEAMVTHGIINDKNKKAIAKLLAASEVPEIASIQL